MTKNVYLLTVAKGGLIFFTLAQFSKKGGKSLSCVSTLEVDSINAQDNDRMLERQKEVHKVNKL